MKKSVIIGIFSASLLLAGPIGLDYSDIFNDKRCSKIVEKSTYDACYDYELKSSRAVSYVLRSDEVNSVNIKKRPRFYEEYSIPKKHRAHYNDFYGGHIDRGHMRSDASTDFSRQALLETYSLVNIVAQYDTLNREMWSKAEKYSRYVATKLGEVNVINLITYDQSPQRIGRNRVAVPSGFYKIIFEGNGGEGKFKRCFYYKNEMYSEALAKKDRLRKHEVDCKSINASAI